MYVSARSRYTRYKLQNDTWRQEKGGRREGECRRRRGNLLVSMRSFVAGHVGGWNDDKLVNHRSCWL